MNFLQLEFSEYSNFKKSKEKAIVVLSGGQDSTTCLGLALMYFEEVYCIGFAYGQRHSIELKQAEAICKQYDVSLTIHHIPSLSELSDSALTGTGDFNKQHHRKKNLPASFVPNRNAMFLTIAHAYAQKMEANYVITGVCETDYSGYPDCRNVFIESLTKSLNLGYETDIKILTPLMWLNKAQTFELARNVDFLDAVINMSHTCYEGNHKDFYSWGYGCGKCPACKLRAEGFYEFMKNTPARKGV